jgi:DNA-directed RNA polymerase alpha subunit
MENKFIIEDLYKAIEEEGLIESLYAVFGKDIKVKILFPDFVCQTKIEELNLSVRGYNCLKRVGISYIGDLINMLEKSDLYSIRNLGKKPVVEIKTTLLDYVYKSIPKADRIAFLKCMLEDNKVIIP